LDNKKKIKNTMEEEQHVHPQLTSVAPKTGIKWSGILWIAGIALVACVLFISFILSCYAVSQLPSPKTAAAAGAAAPAVLGSGDIEIQVQYYAPGNSITPFTVTARVSSYQYLAYPNGYRVLVIAPFSYVFNKIPQAAQVSFTLVNPNPRVPALAGLQQAVQALTSAPFRVSGNGLATTPQYSVVMGKGVVIQFLPYVIASMTTPYTLTLQDEIRFVAGIQV
jgi:hypothetical protein